MPGSIRRTKTRMWGPKAMPNDPLEVCRQEISEFDTLLTVLGSCATTIQISTDMLGTAPEPLVETLQRSFPKGHDQSGDLVARLLEKTTMFGSRVKNGETHIRTMVDNIQELRKTINDVREQFTGRDNAWQMSKHYDSKVEGLQSQLAKKGSISQKLAEKISRNQQKQQESEQAYQREMAATAKQVNEVLEQKWPRVGQALVKLCRFYITIFDGADQMVRDLSVLVEELTRTCSVEDDWVRKAQSLGQQAKDRASGFASSAKEGASGFASSAREKLDNARGSLSGLPSWGRSSSSGGGGGSAGDEGNPFDDEADSPSPSPSPSPALVHRTDSLSSAGAGSTRHGSGSPWASISSSLSSASEPAHSKQTTPTASSTPAAAAPSPRDAFAGHTGFGGNGFSQATPSASSDAAPAQAAIPFAGKPATAFGGSAFGQDGDWEATVTKQVTPSAGSALAAGGSKPTTPKDPFGFSATGYPAPAVIAAQQALWPASSGGFGSGTSMASNGSGTPMPSSWAPSSSVGGGDPWASGSQLDAAPSGGGDPWAGSAPVRTRDPWS